MRITSAELSTRPERETRAKPRAISFQGRVCGGGRLPISAPKGSPFGAGFTRANSVAGEVSTVSERSVRFSCGLFSRESIPSGAARLGNLHAGVYAVCLQHLNTHPDCESRLSFQEDHQRGIFDRVDLGHYSARGPTGARSRCREGRAWPDLPRRPGGRHH